jgi:hypothetical protein
MMIKILSIDTCKRCINLKESLNKKGIFYISEDCSGDNSVCDAIENLTNTELYPIVLIMESNTKINHIVFLTTDYNRLGKKETLGSNIIGIPMHSMDQLIEYTINSYIK